MGIITLLSDFGLQDTFVAQMKGVLLQGSPQSRLVDLTHTIKRHDIADAAWQLAHAWQAFPAGSIHLAVVDPGVGSKRQALAAETQGHTFIAPDNGLLSPILLQDRSSLVHHIERPDLYRRPIADSFHGRDIFAPIAAAIAEGLSLDKLGPVCKDWLRLPHATCEHTSKGLRGSVVHVDHFGNCNTNIPCTQIDHTCQFLLHGQQRQELHYQTHYAAVPPGIALALTSSDGLLEIAVNQGSAADSLHLSRGSGIEVRFSQTGCTQRDSSS